MQEIDDDHLFCVLDEDDEMLAARAKRRSSGSSGSMIRRQSCDMAVPAAISTQRAIRSPSYAAACRGPKVSTVQFAMSTSDASACRVRRHGLSSPSDTDGADNDDDDDE